MSRRGGLQAKTVRMYQALMDLSEEWKSGAELACYISDNYGTVMESAQDLVRRWAADNPTKVQKLKVGKVFFYCSRMQMKPDARVMAEKRWLALPDAFRNRHHRMRALKGEEWQRVVLLAYGAVCLKREDARVAFNEWAAANDHWRIEKK